MNRIVTAFVRIGLLLGALFGFLLAGSALLLAGMYNHIPEEAALGNLSPDQSISLSIVLGLCIAGACTLMHMGFTTPNAPRRKPKLVYRR